MTRSHSDENTAHEDARHGYLRGALAVGNLPGDPAARPSTAKIIRLLERAGAKTGYHIYQLFDKALGVWTALSTDPLQVDMNYWLNSVCVGIERALGPLEEAYYVLLESASWRYEDVLGSVYMELWISNSRTGQVFTPMPMARAMAELALTGLEPRAPGDDPYTIYDPCCGSGVMFLAAMEYIETHMPHMLDDNLVAFYGQDIDATCVSMAKLNLRLHLAGRMLRRELQTGGDTRESLDGHGALVTARPAPERFCIRRTDTLSEGERAQVAAATGGHLPVQEHLSLDPPEEGAWGPSLQQDGEQGGTSASPGRRSPARTKENGARQECVQPRLFVTDLPLPAGDGA